MNAVVADMYPLADERVTHVAFRCGCVRSLREGDAMPASCPEHKEAMVSFTAERVSRFPVGRASPPWLDPR
jgi:hypothetical protein